MFGFRPFAPDLRAALALVIVAVGCPAGRHGSAEQSTFITTENREAERAFRDATRALEEGDETNAQARFEDFLGRYPRDPLTALAHLNLSQLFYRQGNHPQSRHHIEQIEQHPDTALQEQASFVRGLLFHAQGRHQEALQLLLPFVGRTVDPSRSAELLDAVADAALAVGRPVQALSALNERLVASMDDDVRRSVMQRIAPILEAASMEDVRRATETLPEGTAVWERAAAHEVTLAYAAGDIERVRLLIEALEENGVELSDALQEIALRAERPDHPDARVVGALLPLSGPGRVVGQLALQALLLASGSPQVDPSEGPRVVFRDVAGGPDATTQAIDELVSLHRAIALVGPLSPANVAVATARAEELGVPLITLSPRPVEKATAFRLLPTPEEETDALLAAAKREGARRIACLYPDNPFGRTMIAALTASAQRAELVVVTSLPYAPDITSFGTHAASLTEHAFDTLFIPASPQSVSLIAPALRAARLRVAPPDGLVSRGERRVRLLLPSASYAQGLLESSSRYLQGAIVSAPFQAEDESSLASAFVEHFRERFGREPELFAATSYDAFRLLAEVLEQGAATREQVLQSLSGITFSTVSPAGGFTDERGPRSPTRSRRVLETSLQPIRP